MTFSILLRSLAILAVWATCGGVSVRDPTPNTNEDEAKEFIEKLSQSYSKECNKEMVARWDYITDVENTDAQQAADDASVVYAKFQRDSAKEVSTYGYKDFEDVNLYREFRFQADQGVGNLENSELERYQSLQSNMETIYGSATICPYQEPKCETPLSLEPDIENILATSTDFDELKYVWEEWRVQTGKKMREDYIEFVGLSNKAAVNDGYTDTGEYWLNGYTVTQKEAEADIYADPDDGKLLSEIDQERFKKIVEDIWKDVFDSLYKPLHAFVRKKLQKIYPEQIDLKKSLPANILGDMWAQDWTNIGKYVMPYEDEPDYDVTEAMNQDKWTIQKMVDSAEDFFTSINLFSMTDIFKDESIFDQEAWGKTMICHASAEDFCLGPKNEDFRIKMCTEINMVDLVTLHHEMGHIEYFMAYRDQHHVFREAANPGFHEAIGDLIALSVSTPSHMEEILKLTPTTEAKVKNTDKQSINFLMRMALEKIAFLPFGYLIDKYRWGIFDESISTENLNSAWWNLRRKYQGVVPPSFDLRGEEFFDAGAKYHVPANVPYIRYFVSFIAQFQFHKRLCKEAKFDGPLHECDIYGNKDAGAVLKKALEQGMSKPWPLILKDLGDSLTLDAAPIKEYFEPLIKFFEKNLEKEEIGWDEDTPKTLMAEIDTNMTVYLQDLVQKSWNYNTDMNDENVEEMNEASVEFSQVYRSWWDQIISKAPYEELKDPEIQRMYAMQQNIGTAILDEKDLTELNNNLNAMMEDYGATVCPFDDMKCSEDKAYDIDRLEIEMAISRDYSELLYYWEKWRDASGKKMINNFENYVTFMNKAAELNGFKDTSEMWIEPYTTYSLENEEMPLYNSTHFRADIENLWLAVSDKYQVIHAYVRSKLKERNKEYAMYIYDDGLLPANILGNMWAQSWENIYDLVAPYPETSLIDITNDLEENDDVEEMFEIAEDFFVGLNMFEMTDDFWANSMMSQPEGKKVVCHASAWDFYSDEVDNQKDGKFRIKMCTNTNQEDFIVIHHEMGHIEYQMAYSNGMPLIFRDGANPGFHEAIGDTIALSVSTPSHLQKIEENLKPSDEKKKSKSNDDNSQDTPTEDEKRNINFLMKQALSKFVFLPYAYIMDQWRWEVFEGKITRDVYNKKWWEKRIDYQGIRPPITRTESEDFDIGSKFHIPANSPYMSYFVAHILQFQFHQKLCTFVDPDVKLFECDIANNQDAGNHFLKMLKKGASQHWQQQLAEFLETEVGNMDPNAILEYFQPLWDYLDKEVNEEEVGWESGDEVLNNYVSAGENISALVPIIVGVVLVVLVCIVLIAFFVGRNKRKKKDAKKKESMHHERKHSVIEGKINDALEMEDQQSRI